MDVTQSRERSAGRVEDRRLVRGEGRFSDDIRMPGQMAGSFVRSPHAHAKILGVDIGAARAAPGVLAILLAGEMNTAGVGNVSVPPPQSGRDGGKLVVPHRPALAAERVMHVGQPVALVVAETPAQALDAADLVIVEYEQLPAIVDATAALYPGAPRLWPEAPGNLAIDWLGPVPSAENEAEVAKILAAARHRVSFTAVQQRVAGAPLEPRAAAASFDETSGRYTLVAGSQGAGTLRAQVAAALGVDAALVRVVTHDVGGGFGLKTPGYPEYPALLAAARKFGRPVHWAASRSEAFLSDNQGRDAVATAELALDESGRFLALRVDSVVNMGAFLSANGAHIATSNFARCFPTVYAIPKIAVGVRCAFTNTLPTGPYRGAGRPEANYLMERLVDVAAATTGIDPVELRRRNFVQPSQMPHATAVGATIDSGEFEAILDRALTLARHASFEERRAAAAGAGRTRGIGVSCFLEHAGAIGVESAEIAFPERGRLALRLGVQSNGQGHATVFRDLLADRLGIDSDRVEVHEGDSDFGLKGGPSVASRSAMTVSAAVAKASDALIAKGRLLAARQLEAAEADIVYLAGSFAVAGTDRRIDLFDLADIATGAKPRGAGDVDLDTRETVEVPQTFPNGCHVAEVEIEPETGRLRIVNFVAVDDCGTVLDHAAVDGQVVGGLAQGIGQALLEQVVYDAASGQIVTGTFNDYAMPRAADMPPVTAAEHPVFCRTNPLGVKGVGEAGTTGSIAAIMNAVADAIPDGRGADLQMPATAEKLWRACRGRV